MGEAVAFIWPALSSDQAGKSWYLLGEKHHVLRVWAVSSDAVIFEKGKGEANDTPRS